MKSLAENNLPDFTGLEMGMTLSKGIDGTSLRTLSKNINPINITKSIAFLINRFNDSFNAKGKLTPEQIATMSVDLFEVFKYESLEDVVLMFKMARIGKIGDGKDFKLDSQTVFHKFVPQYLEFKAIERENQHSKSKKNQNFEKWDKADIEKFKVSTEKKTVTESLGNRMKEKLDAPETTTPLQDRSVYLLKMKAEVKNQSTDSLKNYIIHNDIKSKNFDSAIFEMVEKELDTRN